MLTFGLGPPHDPVHPCAVFRATIALGQPGYPADRILRGLSLPRRIGYIVVGLGGLAGAAMIGTLWATEPTPLPARTQLAFAALIAVGLAWAAFATWALVRRPCSPPTE